VAPRSILWRRLDLPGHDSARLERRGSGWRLTGTSVFAGEPGPVRLDYRLLCDSRWRTVSGAVTGWIGADAVDVAIAVDRDERRWRMDGRACPAVRGCVDLDLSFTPSTNLLPIRRLAPAMGDEAVSRAAWLRFPELTLEPLEQRYRRTRKDAFRYETGDFVTELRVDEAGFVTHYPPFWRIEKG